MPIDIASIGVTVLILALSFALGLVAQTFLEMTAGLGSLFVGFIEAIAGGHSTARDEPRTNKLAVAARIVLYVCIVGVAIVFATAGMSLYANLCAVIGGLALGLAVIKLFRR